MTRTIRLSHERYLGLATIRNYPREGKHKWFVARKYKTTHGWRYDHPSVAGPFNTKREADEAKRNLREQ